MVLFQRETLEIIPELDALVKDYYSKTEAQVDLPPFDFRWDVYQALGDTLVLVTAREEELQGFVMYIITEHTHHAGLIIADCDTLAVGLGYRGKGLGRRLMTAAECFLPSNVQMVVHRSRACYDAVPLFESVPGYKLVETTYMKRL
jgi:GNAT superfamily N-acetyltransferase